jgi:hypothetical protein
LSDQRQHERYSGLAGEETERRALFDIARQRLGRGKYGVVKTGASRREVDGRETEGVAGEAGGDGMRGWTERGNLRRLLRAAFDEPCRPDRDLHDFSPSASFELCVAGARRPLAAFKRRGPWVRQVRRGPRYACSRRRPPARAA